MELLSVTQSEGVVPRSELEGKNNASEDRSNYKIVHVGDMVYNSMRMWQGANGISSYDGIVSPAYTVLKSRTEIDNGYFSALFKNEKLINEFRKNSQGLTSDTWNLKYAQIAPIKICIPALPEQHMISDFLRKIQVRIELQEALIENIKKYKRGLIKQLLTQKVTFSNSATWHTDRIGNLGTFIKGAPLSKADIADDGQPFILYGELYTTYNEVITSVKRKTHAQVDGCYYSRPGDVIIPTSGETPEEISTASCVMVPNVVLAGDLNIFRSDIIDGRIMSYLLNHVVNRAIARVAQGKSVVHVQAGDLAEIEVTYPDALTQQKMADMLDTINKKLTMRKRSWNIYNKARKGFCSSSLYKELLQ